MLFRSVKFIQITDGTSNTLLFSEIYGIDHVQDGRGLWILPAMGGNTFTTKFPPNSNGTDIIPICPPTWPGAANDPEKCTRNRNDGNVWASARSQHTGGVNVVFADGSVRFVSSSIDANLWRALGSRAGGEVVSGDF